jgi:hypothetical protein
VLVRTSNKPQLLEMYFEPSLTDLAVGASPQAGSRWEVKVCKSDVSNCESGGVRCLYPTSLGVTSVDGCVRNDEGVLQGQTNLRVRLSRSILWHVSLSFPTISASLMSSCTQHVGLPFSQHPYTRHVGLLFSQHHYTRHVGLPFSQHPYTRHVGLLFSQCITTHDIWVSHSPQASWAPYHPQISYLSYTDPDM